MSAIVLQEGDSYLKAKTVREMFDLAPSTFYDLRKKGKIPMPHYPLGKDHPRYLKSEVFANMEASA